MSVCLPACLSVFGQAHHHRFFSLTLALARVPVPLESSNAAPLLMPETDAHGPPKPWSEVLSAWRYGGLTLGWSPARLGGGSCGECAWACCARCPQTSRVSYGCGGACRGISSSYCCASMALLSDWTSQPGRPAKGTFVVHTNQRKKTL
jgi:hypothetical protein